MPGVTNPAEEYFKDGIWGWVTDQWKKLVATAGGALHIQFAGQEADVEVTQTAAADFTPGVCGWDGSAWRKLPLVWGYSDRLTENLGGTKSGAGTYVKYSTAVPAGEVHVVQGVCFNNKTGARGRIRLHLFNGTTYALLASTLTPAQYEVVSLLGEFCLKQGDQVYVDQYNCLDGDVIESTLWGYKMKVAE